MIARAANVKTSGPIKSIDMDLLIDKIGRLYREKNASRNTRLRACYTLKLLKDAGARKSGDVDNGVIRRFEGDLPTSNKERTNFALRRALRAACGHAVQLGHMRRGLDFGYIPPVEAFPRAKKTQSLSIRDIHRLWTHFQTRASSREGHRIFALFATIVLAGLRRDEIVHLLAEDVDLPAQRIRARHREKSTWTKLSSPIPISDQLKFVLGKQIAQSGSKYVFPGDKGGPWTSTSSQRESTPFNQLKAAGEQLGIKAPVHFESLRLFHVDHARLTLPIDPRLTDRRPAVEINGDRSFLVMWKPKQVTPGRFAIVKVLLEAGPDGLSKSDMDALVRTRPSGDHKGSGWRQVLTEMRKDPDWEKAILMAEGAYGRYRIAWLEY